MLETMETQSQMSVPEAMFHHDANAHSLGGELEVLAGTLVTTFRLTSFF